VTISNAEDSDSRITSRPSHVRKQPKKGGHNNTRPRQPSLCRLCEKLGSTARQRHTVQRAGRRVDIGTSGGPGGGEEAGVDDGREDLDSGRVDGDDEWGRGGRAVGEVQPGVVGGHEHANDKDTLMDKWV
jgi:hypothetical protein